MAQIKQRKMNTQLRPIEAEIDAMVNRLYGIEAKEEIELEELDEDVLLTDEAAATEEEEF
jgi:hypothetical protein